MTAPASATSRRFATASRVTRADTAAMSGPWSRHDLTVIATSTALGAALLVASWAGTAGEVTLDDQLVWLGLGVLGLFLIAVANARCILSGRRTVKHEQARLTVHRRRTLAPAPTAGHTTTGTLVAGPRMTRYHLAACPLAAGKDTGSASRATFEERGLTPCGVCRP